MRMEHNEDKYASLDLTKKNVRIVFEKSIQQHQQAMLLYLIVSIIQNKKAKDIL